MVAGERTRERDAVGDRDRERTMIPVCFIGSLVPQLIPGIYLLSHAGVMGICLAQLLPSISRSSIFSF